MQIVLYSSYSVWFINVIGGNHQHSLALPYPSWAFSILHYVGDSLLMGKCTVSWNTAPSLDMDSFYSQELRTFWPGGFCLYSLILYFIIIWTSTSALIYHSTRREVPRADHGRVYRYETAVVQVFTAVSNNFVNRHVSLKCTFFITCTHPSRSSPSPLQLRYMVSTLSSRAARRRRFYGWYSYRMGVPYPSRHEKYVHNDGMADGTERWHQSLASTSVLSMQLGPNFGRFRLPFEIQNRGARPSPTRLGTNMEFVSTNSLSRNIWTTLQYSNISSLLSSKRRARVISSIGAIYQVSARPWAKSKVTNE